MRYVNKDILKFSNGHNYAFNTKANLKNLSMGLLFRAQGIQKSFNCLCILMFSLETCVCLRIVEDCALPAF